ncbi:MAG: hypothetical protein LBK45_01945 [Tannerellaceae bacterium]|jgi:hypothetical protein|nr:hypothetical protein [Tannerellaceae bacterium]
MKKKILTLIIAGVYAGLFPACSQSTDKTKSVESNAKAFLDKLGELEPVTESENMIGLFIESVTKSGDDYIVNYGAKNSIIDNSPDNKKYLMTQVYFIDPENHENRYQPFTIENNELKFSFSAGDEIGFPIRRIKFEPPSKVMYMYFTGIEKSASEVLYTEPLFFTIILGDNPSVLEDTPRHARDVFLSP